MERSAVPHDSSAADFRLVHAAPVIGRKLTSSFDIHIPFPVVTGKVGVGPEFVGVGVKTPVGVSIVVIARVGVRPA